MPYLCGEWQGLYHALSNSTHTLHSHDNLSWLSSIHIHYKNTHEFCPPYYLVWGFTISFQPCQAPFQQPLVSLFKNVTTSTKQPHLRQGFLNRVHPYLLWNTHKAVNQPHPLQITFVGIKRIRSCHFHNMVRGYHVDLAVYTVIWSMLPPQSIYLDDSIANHSQQLQSW